MKHDVWMLGYLLFKICNSNKRPFCYVYGEKEKKSEAEKQLQIYESEMSKLRDRAAPEVLPLAKDIYMQMLVIDPK